jgi:hypothetical protein
MTPAHTELPWHLEPGHESSDLVLAQPGGDGQVIVTFRDCVGDPELEANAAFICRAVNSHYALVEALKVALNELRECKRHNGLGCKAIPALESALAIAAAEGRE